MFYQDLGNLCDSCYSVVLIVMDSSNLLYVQPSDGPGSLPVHEKLLGASNY